MDNTTDDDATPDTDYHQALTMTRLLAWCAIGAALWLVTIGLVLALTGITGWWLPLTGAATLAIGFAIVLRTMPVDRHTRNRRDT